MKEKLIFYSLKTIEFSFYALFFLVPLVLSNGTSELFELNKMWVTWSITIIILTAWIVKMLANEQFKIVRTPLDIPILLFLLSQFISTILSQDIHVSLWGYYSRFNGGFFSLLSYVLLYYAFVSNYHEIQKAVQKKSLELTTRMALFAGSILIIFISIPLAAPPDPASDGHPILFYLSLLVSLIALVLAFRPGFFKRLFSITLTSALIVTLWGIPSHFGSDPTCYLFRGTLSVDCWTESFQPTVRIFSTLGQPAWLAAYLSFLLPVALAFALYRIPLLKATLADIKNSTCIIYYVLCLLFYVGLLFANTRGGFIGFWIGNLFFWLGIILLATKPWKSVLKLFLTINLSFALLTFVFGIPINQLQNYTLPALTRSQASAQTPTQNTPEEPQTPQPEEQTNPILITESGNIRLNVWQGAINAWKAHPLFGTGVETFAFAYYKYKPVAQNLTSEWDFLYNKAHNEYLNYLATTGIVGLVTYLLLIAWFLFLLVKWAFVHHWLLQKKLYEQEPNLLLRRTLIIGLVAGYVTILISNFFGFSVIIINIFFFLTPAFVFVLNSSLKDSHAIVFPRSSKNETGETVSPLRIISIAVLILIAFYLNMVLLRYWNADKAYALGANLDRVGEYAKAYPLLENAVKLRGGEPTFRDEYAFNNAAIASSYLLQNDATQAAQFIRNATSLSNSVVEKHPQNVVFWKNRVRVFYLLSQVDPQFLPSALQSIQKAYELAPNDAKISYNFGVILGQMGRIDEAITQLENTIRQKPDFRDAYYALALFYRNKATGGVEDGPVVDPQSQQKAEDTLQFILERVNPKDKQVQESLESWRGR